MKFGAPSGCSKRLAASRKCASFSATSSGGRKIVDMPKPWEATHSIVAGLSAAAQIRRMRLLERARIDRGTLDRIEVAVMLELDVRPGSAHEVEAFLEPRSQLVEVHPELLDLLEVDAAADADLEPPVREDVEHRALLGEPERLVEGHDVDHRADPDSLSVRRKRRHHQVRRGQQVVRGEVVLGKEDRIEPEPLGSEPLLKCSP